MDIKQKMMETAVKAVLPFLPELTPKLEEYVAKSLDERALADGEARTIYTMLIGTDKQVYIVVAYVNADDKIVRTEAPLKLSAFFEQLLKQL